MINMTSIIPLFPNPLISGALFSLTVGFPSPRTVTHHPDLICQEQRSQTEPLNKERLFPENPATKLDLKMRTKLRRVRKLVRNKINQVNAMLDEREILDDKINKFEVSDYILRPKKILIFAHAKLSRCYFDFVFVVNNFFLAQLLWMTT